MAAARFLLCCLVLCCGAMPVARADDFPRGLIREQFEQASRPVEVDLGQLRPGEIKSVEYVGRPVFVYRRTKADRANLSKWPNGELADPAGANMTASVQAAYASSASLVWARLLLVDQPALEKRRLRSYRSEYLVAAGWSPQSGCRLEAGSAGGRVRENAVFTDSCLGTSFDAAGRALRNRSKTAAAKDAPYNLYLPPHHFDSRNRLVIGLRPNARVPELGFAPASLYRDSDPTHNLIIAARYNDPAVVESALAQGADINAFRPGEGSPLDAAIIGSPLETVKMLIARGARPTSRSIRSAEFVGRKEVWELLEDMALKERSR
jgi:Rieske Fe-S protein